MCITPGGGSAGGGISPCLQARGAPENSTGWVSAVSKSDPCRPPPQFYFNQNARSLTKGRGGPSSRFRTNFLAKRFGPHAAFNAKSHSRPCRSNSMSVPSFSRLPHLRGLLGLSHDLLRLSRTFNQGNLRQWPCPSKHSPGRAPGPGSPATDADCGFPN